MFIYTLFVTLVSLITKPTVRVMYVEPCTSLHETTSRVLNGGQFKRQIIVCIISVSCD